MRSRSANKSESQDISATLEEQRNDAFVFPEFTNVQAAAGMQDQFLHGKNWG